MVLNARVNEILLDKYILEIDKTGEIIQASIRGNTKKKNNILVGDQVEVEFFYDRYMITKIYTRKNSLIRPPVANIDNLVIVISLSNPIPDYFLLDKQLVLCQSKNISPIIVVNKIDLNLTESTKKDMEYIQKVYQNLGIDVFYVSSKENIGINELQNSLKGKVSAFSGNSGVGKSSIINSIFKGNIKEALVSDIARKTSRGKHTTRHVKIYSQDDVYILDTPGFSSYELYDINYRALKGLYPEFSRYECSYLDCNHINENIDVCSIKQKVQEGNIDFGRYERYKELFLKLKEIEARKYK